MPQGVSTPFGFRPLRHLAGGTVGRTKEFTIASGYATAIGQGDFVKLLADGTIAKAAAGDRNLGAFAGVQYTAADGSAIFTNLWPASTVATNIRASIIADPMVTYEVQWNKVTAPDQTDVGLLADLVVGTPSPIHGGSTAYLNGTASTAVAGFRIIGLIGKPDNFGIYSTVEVQVVEHEYLPIFTGTPGV